MDDHFLLYVVESVDDLNCKSSNQIERKPFEISSFQKVIQIEAEQFKSNTKVVSKLIYVFHSNDVVLIFRIVISQMGQNLDLNLSLVFKLLAVLNYLQSNHLLLLMIKALDTLSK